jgi:hypothetical protein
MKMQVLGAELQFHLRALMSMEAARFVAYPPKNFPGFKIDCGFQAIETII